MSFRNEWMAVLSGLKPAEIIFRLPLYLSVVCISANFNTGPLGTTLLVVCVLMVPAHFSMQAFFRTEGRKSQLMLSIVLFLAAVALAFGFTPAFGLAVGSYAIISWLTARFDGWIFRGILLGFLPTLMVYLGLNGYELASVLQGKLLALAAIWLLYFGMDRPNELEKRWERGMTFQLTALTLLLVALYFFIQSAFGVMFANRLGLFLFVPVVILMIWALQVLRRKTTADSIAWYWWWRTTSMLGFVAYFFWLFVVFTNVLQVFS